MPGRTRAEFSNPDVGVRKPEEKPDEYPKYTDNCRREVRPARMTQGHAAEDEPKAAIRPGSNSANAHGSAKRTGQAAEAQTERKRRLRPN